MYDKYKSEGRERKPKCKDQPKIKPIEQFECVEKWELFKNTAWQLSKSMSS